MFHYLLSNIHVFEQDFRAAWKQRGTKRICLFSTSKRQEMYINEEWDDKKVVEMMRIHYRLFQRRKGLVALLTPKRLAYIAVVKVIRLLRRALT
jgi:transcriptional regulator of heat shock response